MTNTETLTSLGYEIAYMGGDLEVHRKVIGNVRIYVGDSEGGALEDGDETYGYSVWVDGDEVEGGEGAPIAGLRAGLLAVENRYIATDKPNIHDLGICIAPGPMVTPFETTLGDFLDHNPELAEDEAAIVDALTDGRDYHFGGGAAPEFTISIPSA